MRLSSSPLLGPALDLQTLRSKVDVGEASLSAVQVMVDGAPIQAIAGESIAAALFANGHRVMRSTDQGKSRSLYCGMGVCFECLVAVNGKVNQRACMTAVDEGMVIETGRLALSDSNDDVDSQCPDAGERVCDLLVIGAGPAGLAAARAARKAGVPDVIVLDERATPGGQYYKQLLSVYTQPPLKGADSQHNEGADLIAEVRALGASILSEAVVWGVFEQNLVAAQLSGHEQRFRARQIILATGAYERPAAVPGWTLPGVMTTGAAQTLLRAYRVFPGEKILIAGNGPLNFQLASELIAAGAHVVAVVELAAKPSWVNWRGVIGALRHSPGLLLKGARYLALLWKRRVPVMYGYQIQRISGENSARCAVVMPVEQRGSGQAGHIEFDVDSVCLGYGFLPSTELAKQMGCEHRYDENACAWLPVRGHDGATSVENVFIAGDGGGLGGAMVALEQGALSGYAAAHALGYGSLMSHKASLGHLAQCTKHKTFQKSLWSLFSASALPITGDKTLICRCEDVTLGQARNAIEHGARTLDSLKRRTRAGMGRCQGRYCSYLLDGLLSGSGVAQQRSGIGGMPVARPPAKPLRIESVALQQPAWDDVAPYCPIDYRLVSSGQADLESADVLIIGAGILGLSLAYQLLLEGINTCVIEAGVPGTQASGVNAGSLQTQMLSYHARLPVEQQAVLRPMLALAPRAIDAWHALEQSLGRDIGLQLTGGLMVVDSEAQLRTLHRKLQIEKESGQRVDFLDGREIRARWPFLADTILGGGFSHNEGKVNPLLVNQALMEAIEKLGGRVLQGAPVVGVERIKERGRFLVHTGVGKIRCTRLVNAAGPWAASVGALLGLQLPVYGKALHMNVTERTAPMLDILVSHGGYNLTMKQVPSGNFIIGGGWLSQAGSQGTRTRVRYDSIRGNMWVAQTTLPSLREIHLLRTWTGIAPIIQDSIPLLGEVPAVPGFFNCISEIGYTLGPLCAKLLAQQLSGHQAELDMQPFSITRF